MKIIVKTLKGEKFPIEVEASATVEAIKQIIVRFECHAFVVRCVYYLIAVSTDSTVLLHVHVYIYMKY